MPVTAMAIGAIAAPIAGGVVGSLASAGDREKAEKAFQDAQDLISQIGAPPDLSKQIILQKFQSAGVLNPKLEQYINAGPSEVSQITENPELAKAQMAALSSLQERGRIGLTPEDKLRLNQIRSQVAQDTEAKRQQILQNFQARGMGGAGAELAAQLSSSQAGAQTASQQADQLAAQASQNALQSMLSSGQLGGQIRGQEFDINKARAAAADEMNRFNIAAQRESQARNVGSENKAGELNLSQAQRLMDINTQTANAEQLRQAEATRQNFLDKLGLAQAKAGAKMGASDFYGKKAAGTQQSWQNIGSGVGSGLGAASSSGAFKSTPKYSTTTGQSLYNPETGVSYAEEVVPKNRSSGGNSGGFYST